MDRPLSSVGRARDFLLKLKQIDMTQEEKLQKEIERIVSWEEELNYFENKGDLIEFVARHFYTMGRNTDETIRKELIFFLEEEIPQCSIKEHADKLKEFVSYLKKQKEDYSSFSEEQRKYMKKYILLDKITLVKLLAERDMNIAESIKSFNECFDEKEQNQHKADQKPVEWSKEDKKTLDSVIRIITQFDDLAHEPTYAGPKWTHPYTKELNFLEKLCNGLFKENN